jgi:hypothetical protein
MRTEQGLVALIDESANQHFYRIAALVVHARWIKEYGLALDDVAARASEAYGTPAAAELHGHSLFQGSDDWTALHPRQRIGIYGDGLAAVARYGEAIFIRGVHRPRFRERYARRPDYNEHEAALMFVMENVNAHALRTNSSVRVVADECRFAASIRRSLETFKVDGTWGYRAQPLTHIDDITFVSSKDYRPVQGIDLVAYLKTRRASRLDTDPRAIKANRQLWEKIAHLVSVDRDWYPL